MKQFISLMKKDFMELFRTKKILILGIVFLFFTILSPISAYLLPDLFELIGQTEQEIIIIFPDPTYVDSYYQFISNFGQMVVFVMIIVLAPLIVDEKRKGTFHTLLNNKVSKANFVLSKVLSQVKVITGLYLISIGAFLLYTKILFDQAIFSNWILFFVSIYFYLIFLICMVNLISVISKTNITSIVMSILAFFSIMIFNFIPFIGKYMPNHLMTIATNIITDGDYAKYANGNIIVTILLSIVLLFLSIKLCSYED